MSIEPGGHGGHLVIQGRVVDQAAQGAFPLVDLGDDLFQTVDDFGQRLAAFLDQVAERSQHALLDAVEVADQLVDIDRILGPHAAAGRQHGALRRAEIKAEEYPAEHVGLADARQGVLTDAVLAVDEKIDADLAFLDFDLLDLADIDTGDPHRVANLQTHRGVKIGDVGVLVLERPPVLNKLDHDGQQNQACKKKQSDFLLG